MANSPLLDSSRSGPVLGAGRHGRRSGWSQPAIFLAVLAGLGLWLAYSVIFADLGAGVHVGTTHSDADKGSRAGVELPKTAVASALQVPGALPAPAAQPRVDVPELPQRARPGAQLDGAARTLVAAGRDHLARKVTPTTWSIDDPRANSGNHLDLLERGLADQLSLQTAVVRHRTRNPQLYGLATKPAPTLEERRRAWNIDNLGVFLTTYADVLGTDNLAELEAGDIVFVQRKHGSSRKLAAVVSDVGDESGNPQIIVLDPKERAPREVPVRANYALLNHFRLTSQHLEKIRQALDLGSSRGPLGTTL